MVEENRRHFRLREFIDVVWKVADQGISGEGMVVNISSSGLLLQTDQVFSPSRDCILSVESSAEALPFSSKNGRIVWFRRIGTAQERLQCGVQFLPDSADNGFQQWLEMKVNQLSNAGDVKILGNLAY